MKEAEIKAALQELLDRVTSDVRPADKYLTSSIGAQWNHILTENNEEQVALCEYQISMNDETRTALAMELVDGQMSRETMLAILGYDAHGRREIRRRVIEKNRVRGYYEGGVSDNE